MKRILLAGMIAALALGPAMAQETCATKAVDKNGKPLAGATLNSFLKKCKREACELKAVNPFTTRGPDPLGSPMAILFPPGGPPRPCSKKAAFKRPIPAGLTVHGKPLDA